MPGVHLKHVLMEQRLDQVHGVCVDRRIPRCLRPPPVESQPRIAAILHRDICVWMQGQSMPRVGCQILPWLRRAAPHELVMPLRHETALLYAAAQSAHGCHIYMATTSQVRGHL
jgi:hypothetical protein